MEEKYNTPNAKKSKTWQLVKKGRPRVNSVGSSPLAPKSRRDQPRNPESHVSSDRQATVISHISKAAHDLASPTFLQAVASDIPRDKWKPVFRTLMACPQASIEIENIEYKCTDLGEQKYQALQKWQKSYGNKATILELDKALRKHHCSSVADNHTRPFFTSEVQDSKESVLPKKEDRVPNFQVRLISVEEPNVQAVLEGDTVTITIPSKVCPDFPRTEDASSMDTFFNRARVAVTLLDTIINPMQSKNRYKMELSELANRFEEKYRSCFKFKHLGVGRLTSFIKQSCWFTLEQDTKGIWYVEQTLPKQRPSFDSGIGGKDNLSLPSIYTASSDSEMEGYATCKSLPRTPFQGTPFSTPPPHRKTRAQRNLLRSLTLDKKICPDDQISEQFFDQLLKQPSSKCLKFVLESEYHDQEKFTYDVVSMWNTPDRESSHIVIGVSASESPPNGHVGLKRARNNVHYQSLFLQSSFSYKPPYGYSEILFKGDRYGVIKIPNSYGYENRDPCYAEDEDPNGRWHFDSICFCNPENCMAQGKSVKSIRKWFKGKKASNSESPENDQSPDKWQQEWEYIQTEVGELSHKAVCSLVVSECVSTRHLSVLGKFPWQKVWDFDQESHESGFYYACKDDIEGRMKVSTLKDPVDQQHCDGSTDWIFVRGMVEKEDSMIVSKNFRDWFSKVKRSLNDHCQELASQCEEKKKPLIVVILWYDNFEYLMHLTRLLEKIDESVDGTKFVLIMPHLPEDEEQVASLKCLCKQFDIETIPQIPLSKLCQNLYQCPCPFQFETCQKFKLPTTDGTFLPDINEKDANWYGEEFDVLYTTGSTQQTSPGNNLGESFLSGQPIVWSECDLGLLDAKRSLYNPIRQHLMGCILKRTPVLITLRHEPRGGGTTLARRLLWDLHFVSPCVSIQSPTFDTHVVFKGLESLHQKTNLPIVVLADRVAPDLLEKLRSENVQNIPIIILALQHVTSDYNAERPASNQYYLSGSVDASEAVSLAYVFSHNLTAEKTQEVNFLAEDVRKGQAHCMVEFGLAAFGANYNGLYSFVRYHLGAVNAELLPWQLYLGYLAITSSYAKTGLLFEFFNGIFPESESVNQNRFEHSAQQLIAEDTNESTWIIKHLTMSDEILEQILHPQQHVTSQREQDCGRLTTNAKDHLANFVMTFITYVSQQIPKMLPDQRSKVMDVLYKLFFSPVGKSQPGTLLSDIDEVGVLDATMERKSKQVLTHLSQCFPDDQHIGAFL